MLTEPASTHRQPEPAWQHMKLSFQELSVRIVRLSVALGVSLKDERDLQRVLSRPATPAPTNDRRSTPDRRAGDRAGRGPDRRVAHQWEELRGLLVLRFGVEKRCLDEFGIDVTRRILTETQAQLERAGFERGADGIDVERRFGPA